MLSKSFFAGICFWGLIVTAFFFLRTKSSVHNDNIGMFERKKQLITLAVLAVTVLVCTLPMGLSPVWNGEMPEDSRNQYELMAESILNGHLYFDYNVDSRLMEMENPYDYESRYELGVSFYWDHAFYNGRYYMYFGIVPVILLFLPYRVITGTDLVTYHATQIFVAFFICGVFATFYMLAKKFFSRMSFVMYLLLSAAFAVMSIWNSIGTPALYCTAVTAALCLEIWSMYFFIKAVWVEEDDRKRVWLAFLGGLLGALAFGCRPPIALANLLVLPICIEYIRMRNRHLDFKLFKQLIFVAAPYIIIGILLMTYNYVRFDNPLEFGQTYQLTMADQSAYGDFLEQFSWTKTVNGILQNFISYKPLNGEFPYVSNNNSVFINFPILLFLIIGLSRKGVRAELRRKHFALFIMAAGIVLPLLITIFDVIYSPWLLERYRMDIYWLMGMSTFMVAGFYNGRLPSQAQRKFSHGMTVWALVTVLTCFLLFIVPDDRNYTQYFPEALRKFEKVILFR